MKFFEKIFKLIYPHNKERELARIFNRSIIIGDKLTFAKFPSKTFLGNKNIYAYSLDFMATNEIAAGIFKLITSFFSTGKAGLREVVRAGNNNGESIHFSTRQEFHGTIFEIITNSSSFLKALDALSIKPPAPWISFPDVDPDTLGSMQGSLDYWWNWYWSPYWDTLNKQERLEYLQQNNAGPEWIECIDIHSKSGVTIRVKNGTI